jgi:hypothetical protein
MCTRVGHFGTRQPCASLWGLLTNFADVHRFVELAGTFRDVTGVPADPRAQSGLLDG